MYQISLQFSLWVADNRYAIVCNDHIRRLADVSCWRVRAVYENKVE